MDLTICGACGVQYSSESVDNCKICDDPRQFVPPEGQWWTTLRSLRESQKHHNEFSPIKNQPNLISIVTVPPVAIGQRALLCRTAKGNVLWDCITYLDEDTIRRINELGGIKAIAISHPHFYSSSSEWAKAFDCPVFYSSEDTEWIMRFGTDVQKLTSQTDLSGCTGAQQVRWSGPELDLLDGEIKVVKTGGHFPGSSVLYWKEAKKLLTADSIMVVPSGVYAVNRPPGTTSFTFMWSYPNAIPLPPDAVHRIWKSVAHFEFEDVHGGFVGRDTYGNSKQRLLDSVKLYVKHMGYAEHSIHQESL